MRSKVPFDCVTGQGVFCKIDMGRGKGKTVKELVKKLNIRLHFDWWLQTTQRFEI